MANSRDIKRHIESVQSTQQITKAMKVVSAAKLHKVQASALAARPYTQKLTQVIQRILENQQGISNPLMELRIKRRVAIILMTGNKGLAGGFNGNLIRLATDLAEKTYQDCYIDFIPVGSKGRDYLRSHVKNMSREFIKISDVPKSAETIKVAEYVTERFLIGEYDAVDIVYQAFLSPGHQKPRVRTLLPLVYNLSDEKNIKPKNQIEYLYEPNAASVLKALIPMYINNIVYQTILETKAGEFVARLIAMSAATDNADKMIGSLVLSYNRTRQAAITKELSEIMGGANALEQIEIEAE